MTTDPTNINTWLDDETVAAIIVSEQLEPAGAEGVSVIYPPTFRGRDDTSTHATKSTHVINTMRNPKTGQEVLHVTLDTPQSQANRMEPMFKGDRYEDLVPKVEIERQNPDGSTIRINLLDVGHRIADAGARHTERIGEFSVNGMLEEFSKARDIRILAKIAPTALLLGFWDSRGTGVKWPRIINSTIEAEGVSGAAERGFSYNPAFEPKETFSKEEHATYGKKGAGNKAPLSQEGLDQSSDVMLGGVLVDSSTQIRRRTILNLTVLRRALWNARDTLHRTERSGDKTATQAALAAFEETRAAARYLLGLAMVMVTAPLDGDLRQGCLLVRKEDKDAFAIKARCFDRSIPLSIDHEAALEFARKARDVFFKDGLPAPKLLRFSTESALKAMQPKDKDEDDSKPKKTGASATSKNGKGARRSEVGAS